MVVVAQLVRVAVCGAAGRRFEPGQPPGSLSLEEIQGFFCVRYFVPASHEFEYTVVYHYIHFN